MYNIRQKTKFNGRKGDVKFWDSNLFNSLQIKYDKKDRQKDQICRDKNYRKFNSKYQIQNNLNKALWTFSWAKVFKLNGIKLSLSPKILLNQVKSALKNYLKSTTNKRKQNLKGVVTVLRKNCNRNKIALLSQKSDKLVKIKNNRSDIINLMIGLFIRER